jgi:hypothetical protein
VKDTKPTPEPKPKPKSEPKRTTMLPADTKPKRTTMLPADTKPTPEQRRQFDIAKQKLYEYWKEG